MTKYLTKEQRDGIAMLDRKGLAFTGITQLLDHADEAERLLVECSQILQGSPTFHDRLDKYHVERGCDESCWRCHVDRAIAKLKAAGIPD